MRLTFAIWMLCLCGLLCAGCEDQPPPETESSASSSSPAAHEAQKGPRFADVAEPAGLHYRWEIKASRPLTILQTIGNGCAFLDYDNDNNLDILLIGPKLALYKGDGKGNFTDVTHDVGLDSLSGHFLGCAVGDYDNDGYEDIYISGYRTGLLLHNEGGKRFRDVTRQAGLKDQPWGTSCAFADIDGDGKLDLYIGNYVQFGSQAPQLCEQGNTRTACNPQTYDAVKGVLYRNMGGGRFQDVTQSWRADRATGKTLGVAFADFNGSGHPSLALANDQAPGNLLLNEGKDFLDIASPSNATNLRNGKPQAGMGLDWGDYDNDGRLDLVIANFAREMKAVYHNDGVNQFTETSTSLNLNEKMYMSVAFGVKWFDYDNDGWLDLIFANGHTSDNVYDFDTTLSYRQKTHLIHNEQGKKMVDVSETAGPDLAKPLVGRGLAVGDYDNDGRLDVLIVDSEGTPLLLHNQTPESGHWLSLKLVGTQCNRDGIGALVTVETTNLKQKRLCHTDGSYLSASDRRVHIGLGTASTADVTVQWPDGRTDVLKGLAADQRFTLREGDAQVHEDTKTP